MSATANGSVRCDGCGRLSRHPLGEYAKPGGSAGYIDSKGQNTPFDWCDECEKGLCPACGSPDAVRITPATPGPSGWGGRCKACGHAWSLPEIGDGAVFSLGRLLAAADPADLELKASLDEGIVGLTGPRAVVLRRLGRAIRVPVPDDAVWAALEALGLELWT